MEKKIALLSNVNMDYAARELAKEFSVWRPEGYGELWEPQLDPGSSFSRFDPDLVILLVDAWQLLGGAPDRAAAKETIDAWFRMFRSCRRDSREYLVSDIQFGSKNISDMDEDLSDFLESYWKERLAREMDAAGSVHRLRLCDTITDVGRSSFYSEYSWYMGKMPYTRAGYRAVAGRIRQQVNNMCRTPKKVLVLDLDNTLWGGILGEVGETGITLSDDGAGAAYRDAQKLIGQMRRRGVLLAVCSRNNPEDVRRVWERNPYMVLKEEDFAIQMINWEDKVENLKEIARQMKLGLDSFVFIDDMAAERENVRLRLPMVEVPEFPELQDEIPLFFQSVYVKYFQKSSSTQEDMEKTEQYHQNAMRDRLEGQMDYEAFLEHLELQVERIRIDDMQLRRIVQLFRKTNQFNLTSKRYTEPELREKLADGWKLYAWRVADRFGEYGVVAAALVDTAVPRIDSFLMSCRIMGKQLENCFLEQVEQDMRGAGKMVLQGEYIPTDRNMPVKRFYEKNGYQMVSDTGGRVLYEISLDRSHRREYTVKTCRTEE